MEAWIIIRSIDCLTNRLAAANPLVTEYCHCTFTSTEQQIGALVFARRLAKRPVTFTTEVEGVQTKTLATPARLKVPSRF